MIFPNVLGCKAWNLNLTTFAFQVEIGQFGNVQTALFPLEVHACINDFVGAYWQDNNWLLRGPESL